MALKQLKFGSVTTPIAMTQVAINENSNNVLSVVGTNTGVEDNADPTYTIALAVDGKTITKTGDSGLATALKLTYHAAVTTEGSEKGAYIALEDNTGTSIANSEIPVESLIGNGVLKGASYKEDTGILTLTFATASGVDNTVEVNLGTLLDIDDVAIATDSQKYLNVALSASASETGNSQAVFSAKVATVTGSTSVLSVDATNGSLLDASETITAVKTYVDGQVGGKNVTAQGDDYVGASASDNEVTVVSNVQDLTATAGTAGTYDAEGAQTTAPVIGTLSGTANSLVDGADVATKVKTYVDGAIAIEVARADAKVLAAVKALDNTTDAAVAGQYVAAIEEVDGIVSVKTRANVSDAVLTGYTKGSDATAVAATDDVKGAIAKLENQVDAAISAATVAHSAVEKDTNASHLTLTSTTDSNGKVTYTIGETDIASDSDLTTEVTRAQTAEGEIATKVGLTGAEGSRTFTPTTNYGGSSATVMANMQAIDTQLKAVSDAASAIQYQISGTTLEFFGISDATA